MAWAVMPITKWGLRGITKTAAMEFGHHGVRVNSIHPGGVNTVMGNPGGATGDALQKDYTMVPLQRIGEPGRSRRRQPVPVLGCRQLHQWRRTRRRWRVECRRLSHDAARRPGAEMTPQAAFAGGVAVITGAGSGIGAALARHAAGLGMKVALADIDAAAITALAAELEPDALAIPTDVRSADAMLALAAAVRARWGAVRLLVNCAGIETLGNSWDIAPARWQATLDINVMGAIHGVHAFVPAMLATGEPAFIANVASVGAFGQMPMQAAYITSKHALQALTETLALEIGLTGKPIHVASVIPGAVATAIFDSANHGRRRRRASPRHHAGDARRQHGPGRRRPHHLRRPCGARFLHHDPPRRCPRDHRRADRFPVETGGAGAARPVARPAARRLTMPFTLQQLSDLEDIKLLKHAYFRCIDTANEAELITLFTDDVTIDLRGGGYRAQFQGKQNMVDFIASAFNSDIIAQHHGHMPEIRFTGPDTAEGSWYLEDRFINPERATDTIGTAIYRDRYVRTPDAAGESPIANMTGSTKSSCRSIRGQEITSHLLASTGRKPEARIDISKFLTWFD